MTTFIASAIQHAHHAAVWLQLHGILPQRGVQVCGFIWAIWAVISAIFTAVETVAQWVIDAGELVFNSLEDVAQFAARGVVWLTGTIRDGLSALFSGLKDVFGTIEQSLEDFWNKVSDFFTKVRAFLKPVTDFLKKIQTLYDHYWQEFVKPVLDVISRVRQALQIFKYFHLQWAAQLDGWLADVQQQIIKNTLQIHQWLSTVINWVNAVSDPYGFMKLSPILGGFINGLDNFWMAITGERFFGTLGTTTGLLNTAHVQSYFTVQVQDIQNGTGDAGDIQTRAGSMRSALYSEMGVSQGS